MTGKLPADPGPAGPSRRRAHRALVAAGLVLLAYFVVAYLVVPLVWRADTRHHPLDLSGAPHITVTANGVPGDPLNLALVGSESALILGMTRAGWYPADPITLDSSIRIAVDSVFRRPDDQAPVSDLFLFGRKQDLSFELPVGNSPRQRHHVRFWRWDKQKDGRPVWFGSATFDERVGLSHETGQITHHIGPDVDAERERLAQALKAEGAATSVYYMDGFQQPQGKNGGGDPWHSDGRLAVVILAASRDAPPAPAEGAAGR